MELLLVRHGKAEDRELFARSGQSDEERPLTSAGTKKMKRETHALREFLPRLHTIGSSPLRRALQTAEILSDAYGCRLEPVEALAPGSGPELLLPWLKGQPHAATVALVGHEPDIGGLACWLLAGKVANFIPFKKGGVCLLHIAGKVGPASGELLWSVTPSQLRAMGY